MNTYRMTHGAGIVKPGRHVLGRGVGDDTAFLLHKLSLASKYAVTSERRHACHKLVALLPFALCVAATVVASANGGGEVARVVQDEVDYAKWDQLRIGMKKDEVVQLLGQPRSLMRAGTDEDRIEKWVYPLGGNLVFRKAALSRWAVPAQVVEVHLRRGEIHYKDKWMRIDDLEQPDLANIRDQLEADYEKSAGSDEERSVRQQLRAIRHALGPNRDPKRAFQWRVVCLLARNVNVTWKDREGREHRFQGHVKNPEEWLSWIDREMEQFAKHIFEKSWGKIRVAYVVRSTEVPILHMKSSKGEYWLDDRRVARLVRGTFERGDAVSLFVWVPKDGKGKFPRTGASATAMPGSSFTNGAHFTAFYTSEERMRTPGGWAKERGGGIIHEFWHHARWVLSREPLLFGGWRPSVNSSRQWDEMKEEIRAQGLVPSENRYDEFFASWFTWRMIRKLRAYYGVRDGWKSPDVEISDIRLGEREPSWHTLMSFNVEKGRPDAIKSFRTRPFKVAGRWRIRYGARPARRPDGHLRIVVYREGERQPFLQVANVTDSSRITRNREGYPIEEQGTFVVQVDAVTSWWWMHIDVWE